MVKMRKPTYRLIGEMSTEKNSESWGSQHNEGRSQSKGYVGR